MRSAPAIEIAAIQTKSAVADWEVGWGEPAKAGFVLLAAVSTAISTAILTAMIAISPGD
jgi:hypothetical protein